MSHRCGLRIPRRSDVSSIHRKAKRPPLFGTGRSGVRCVIYVAGGRKGGCGAPTERAALPRSTSWWVELSTRVCGRPKNARRLVGVMKRCFPFRIAGKEESIYKGGGKRVRGGRERCAGCAVGIDRPLLGRDVGLAALPFLFLFLLHLFEHCGSVDLANALRRLAERVERFVGLADGF